MNTRTDFACAAMCAVGLVVCGISIFMAGVSAGRKGSEREAVAAGVATWADGEHGSPVFQWKECE